MTRYRKPHWINESDNQESPTRRPWQSPGWVQSRTSSLSPGAQIRFGPDARADLPLWGIDWLDPPLTRDLLLRLTAWQDQYDDHEEEWESDAEWASWIAEGKVLLEQVKLQLGPGVQVIAEWPLSDF